MNNIILVPLISYSIVEGENGEFGGLAKNVRLNMRQH